MPATSTGFSDTAKAAIDAGEGRCVVCERTEELEYVHVVAQKDSSFEVLRDSGRVSFDKVADPRNGIHLCSVCHGGFDKLLTSPSLFLIPVDIKYFIAYEKENYEKRKKEYTTTGEQVKRQLPTLADIVASKPSSKSTPRDLVPLYHVLLQRPLHSTKWHKVGVGLQKEKIAWRGCPGAMLYHSRKLLQDPKNTWLPEWIEEDVRTITKLYTLEPWEEKRESKEKSESEKGSSSGTESQSGGDDGRGDEGGDRGDGGSGKRKEREEEESGEPKKRSRGTSTKEYQDENSPQTSVPGGPWIYGPSSSSDDKSEIWRKNKVWREHEVWGNVAEKSVGAGKESRDSKNEKKRKRRD